VDSEVKINLLNIVLD